MYNPYLSACEPDPPPPKPPQPKEADCGGLERLLELLPKSIETEDLLILGILLLLLKESDTDRIWLIAAAALFLLF